MKKNFHSPATKLATYPIFAILALGLNITLGNAFAEGTSTDVEQNQLLSFKKVFVDQATDNVDGVFAATVADAYKEIFERNPRFEMVSKRADSDSAVATKLEKKTTGIDIEISLQLTATSEVFSTDRTTLAPTATGLEIASGVKALLKTALRRIPFYGTVTGREGNEVTLDIGAANGLQKGDVVQISRADQIKRHPLLKTIVDVQMVPVGAVSIDMVEETIAFGHVYSEITGEKIQRMQKVTAVEARVQDPKKDRPRSSGGGIIDFDRKTDEPDQSDRPQLGFVSLGPVLGSFSSSTSLSAGATNYSGSSFAPGFKLAGELWLTKNWFADLEFGLTTFSFAQTDQSIVPTPDVEGVSSSTRFLGFDAGYRYLPTGSIYGPFAAVRLGLRSFSFNTTNQTSSNLSSKGYFGLNLGVNGQLPLLSRDNGLLMAINLMLFPGFSEDVPVTSTADSSTTAVNFALGGYYHITSQVSVRAMLQFDIYSVSFGEGATAASTSQHQFTFIPSILYYF